ncbi:MAG: nitric oxide synthase oxygenase [Methylococcales bacterium]|nr:nitric oxide synthase oxygenase [Methylococcales bacterium]
MIKADSKVRSSTLRRRLRQLSPAEIREEAIVFIEQFYRENNLSSQAAENRTKEVLRDLKKHGFYTHTFAELEFGSRVAWRNHSRCIGRLLWRSLKVIDCREFTQINGITDHLVDHIDKAQGNGKIQSIISIFSPVIGNQTPAFIESRQLIQYAGYAGSGKPTIGDPITIESTELQYL